jgi:O-antigen ligase
MLTRKNLAIFYLTTGLFIAADMWLMINKGNYLLNAMPLLLLVVYAFIFHLDKLMLAIVFLTPLSIKINSIPEISLGQINFGVALPTGPLLLGLLLVFILHLSYKGIDREILKHPVSIIIMLILGWVLVTACTSTLPIVSFKFLVQRGWAIAGFYFFGIYLFREKKNIYTFLWMYLISFGIIILYTTYNHALKGFTEKASHEAMAPFYNDHTAYGALLAMYFPIAIGLLWNRTRSTSSRIGALAMIGLFLVGLGLSYSRAAWISIIGALIVLTLLIFRVKLKYIFAALCVAAVGFFIFQTQIILKLQHNNKQVSQNLTTEIASISNISSDASNRERINRWSCAWRMFLDKPVVGFGPGTYSFKYAPYQLSYNKTIISTNLGIMGNAHSEYLGPLSEQGVLGFVGMVALVVMVFMMAFRLYFRLEDYEMKVLVVSIFLGMVTYFIHGIMNDFLDSDKAAVPFWGFIAILVTIDMKYGKKAVAKPAAT